MTDQSVPPWRAKQAAQPSRHPKSTIPAKRRADAEEEKWIADEDRFVLRQAKKKAALRIKGGRAKPIDWLAATLSAVDLSRESGDVDEDEDDLDVVDPEGVFEGLDAPQLRELQTEIDGYLTLEFTRSNKDYWETMKVICKDRLQKLTASGPGGRGVGSVVSDVDKILAPKSLDGLEKLEKQIRAKLDSDEPIDTDYWEHLLRSLLVWKARARLRKVSQAIVQSKLEKLRKEQHTNALAVQKQLAATLRSTGFKADANDSFNKADQDAEPMLKLSSEDKLLETVDEATFLRQVTEERQRVLTLGYVPTMQKKPARTGQQTLSLGLGAPSGINAGTDDSAQSTNALYEREVARGVLENEEVFTNEEDVSTSKPLWANKYRPRKPKYFNRVQMGYEWNKYNQTHYDHDNPPPKVVQGYKFNVFYPDLIDKSKAPTYKIEREGGRKRGQSFAPAGEDDTCLIKFIAGPPYEDIAFRIVDKEWDYSAKRDRGFKSSFDKVSSPGHSSKMPCTKA